MLVEEVDQRTFAVALEAEHGRVTRVGSGSHVSFDVEQGRGTVDLRLAFAQKVQIRPVNEQDDRSGSGRRVIHDAVRRDLRPDSNACSAIDSQAAAVTSACRAWLTWV